MLAFTKEFALGAFGAVCFMLLCLYAATAHAHHSKEWHIYHGPRMTEYIAGRCGFEYRRYGLFARICGKSAYRRYMNHYWGSEPPEAVHLPVEPPDDEVEVQSGPACTPSEKYTCLKIRRNGRARRRSR